MVKKILSMICNYELRTCPQCGQPKLIHGPGNKKWHCSNCGYKEDYR